MTKFYRNKLSLSENITKSFKRMASLHFDSQYIGQKI